MATTHGIPDTLKEIESINFDLLPTCIIATNGLTAPGSGLTMLSVSATGYVRRGTDLLYVQQPAATVTVSSTAGSHWLALTADTWTAIGGWTRIPGSHFVEQANATQPTAPDGSQLVAQITVTGAHITAVTPVLSPPLSRQNASAVAITGGAISLGGHAPTGVLDVQGSVQASDLAPGRYFGLRLWPVVPSGAVTTQAVRIEAATGAGLAAATFNALTVNDQPTMAGVNAIYTSIAAGTGRYNISANGTAPNYFAGNVGIANSAPSYPLDVTGQARVTGNLGVGTAPDGQLVRLHYQRAAQSGIVISPSADSGAGAALTFFNNSMAAVGSITTTGAATAFNTSSDVRLKHAVQPLTDSLAVIAALNPVSHRWNVDDSYAENFLAHELQRVLAYAVTGEPDAVHADGSVNPQQVDLSKCVPRLVGAVKELLAQVEALTARVGTLEAQLGL